MTDRSAVFLDTSIQIARIIHSPGTVQRIERRLREFSLTTTGLVVRQEFKHRLLKDARYLLELFLRYKSFAEVQRHIVDVLTPFQRRKQRISLQLLTTLMEGESDADLSDRAILLLRGLLRDGLYEFDESVGHVIQKARCGNARRAIRRKGNRYEFADEKCNQVGDCEILSFLQSMRTEIQSILAYLKAIPPKDLTTELENAMKFMEAFLEAPDQIRNLDPCKTVGDLLIALESIGIPVFYTMNGKESQHLCRPLNQSLIVRPANPEREDLECGSESDVWPNF